jgi:thioredoxin 1
MKFSIGKILPVAVILGLALVAGCGDPSAMNESTANVKRIAPGDFAEQVTKATGPVVVDFYATWCGPCRMLAPMMEAQADALAGKIKFLKVNVDEAQALAQEYQIQAIPTVLFFKDGKLVDRLTGLPEENDLKSRLLLLTRAP